MDVARIEQVFHDCFAEPYRTRLVGGAEEPLYQPRGEADGEHLIYYRSDYASSALHEIAHWCIAGQSRREQRDYGYWYEPNRDRDSQRSFEAMEVRPQGLEWIMSEAAGVCFRVSVDNFALTEADRHQFRAAVKQQTILWLQDGLPARARTFIQALISHSRRDMALRAESYAEPPS
jgi:elongation factor P hydroxylase